MAAEAVLKYMTAENRPFSVGDVANKLGEEFGKPAVQKALDHLVEKGKLFAKTYNKQKVYCVVQAGRETDQAKADEELRALDLEVSQLKMSVVRLEEEIAAKEKEIRHLESELTTEEAVIAKTKLESEIKRIQSKLDAFSQNNVKPISPEKKRKIETQHEKTLKEYRKRKRICLDMVDSILEGYQKSKTELLEEIGVETDADVGYKAPS